MIKVEKQNGTIIFRLPVSMSDYDILRDLSGKFEKLLPEGWKKIVFDLKETKLLTSHALAILMRCHITARKKGLEVVLLNPGKNVLRIISLTGAAKIFKIEVE